MVCDVAERLENMGRVAGRAEGKAEERIRAIRNMIALGIAKDQIIQLYSEEEYDKAVQ